MSSSLSKVLPLAVFVLLAPLAFGQRLSGQAKLPDAAGANIREMTHFKGKAYFNAYDRLHGNEFWESDGTESGTQMIADIAPGPFGSLPRAFVEFNDRLYFCANQQAVMSGGASGVFLYSFSREGDLLQIPQSYKKEIVTLAIPLGNAMWVWNDQLVFLGRTESNGQVLWATDGVSETPTLLWCDSTGDPLPVQCYVKWLSTTKNALYLIDNDGEIWAASRGKTGMVRVLGEGVERRTNPVATIGDRLLYLHWLHDTGCELHVASTETGSGQLLKELRPGVSGGFNHSGKTFAITLDEKVLFAADDGVHGLELFISDGTPGGTQLLYDVYPGVKSSTPEWFHLFGEKVLFLATDDTHGREPWITDGTPEGTKLLADLSPGAEFTDLHNYADVPGRVFFSATTPATGKEVFVTDGTPEGTRLFSEVISGPQGGQPALSVITDKYLVFIANDNMHGQQLWRADLTTGASALVKVIGQSVDSTPVPPIGPLHGAGDALFFVCDTPTYGAELWRLAQGESAPTLVTDLFPGFAGSHPEQLATVGDYLFFIAESPEHGSVVWLLDAKLSGGVPVTVPDQGLREPDKLTPWKDTLYFTAHHPESGTELWCLRPPYNTPELLIDICPGTCDSNPANLSATPTRIVFTATAEDGTRSFWASGGTRDATHAVGSMPEASISRTSHKKQ